MSQSELKQDQSTGSADADLSGANKVVPDKYLVPFILTTCCFALWGFANDFTNPLVKVYESVFVITTSQASWLQFAFYTGYFCMALPAAWFIRKFSYKAAIMIGFGFYAAGALMAVPAAATATFGLFLLGSYILTYGLAFLETACNPYILAMGSPKTATQRLNLAQAFNPIGSLIGMGVATFVLAPELKTGDFRDALKEQKPEVTKHLVLLDSLEIDGLPEGAKISEVELVDESKVSVYNKIPDFNNTFGELDKAVPNALKAFRANDEEGFKQMQKEDLNTVMLPYIVIAGVVISFLVLFALSKMPSFKASGGDVPFWGVAGSIFSRAAFREGVLAQLFYVGAQIMCWTFIVHYGMERVNLTLEEAQRYNIVAMVIFLSSRWICTLLLRFFSPGLMLSSFAVGAFVFTLGAIYLEGTAGLYSLVLISACMSLMFPTIYGIALNDMSEEESKLGSAFLIMSIVGGAFLTKLQGGLVDAYDVANSFWLPAICFVLIAIYGLRTLLVFEKSTSTT